MTIYYHNYHALTMAFAESVLKIRKLDQKKICARHSSKDAILTTVAAHNVWISFSYLLCRNHYLLWNETTFVYYLDEHDFNSLWPSHFINIARVAKTTKFLHCLPIHRQRKQLWIITYLIVMRCSGMPFRKIIATSFKGLGFCIPPSNV